MKQIYMIFLILLSIQKITPILLKINGSKDDYCFSRDVYIKAELKFTYALSSEKAENINIMIRLDKTLLFNKTSFKDSSFLI